MNLIRAENISHFYLQMDKRKDPASVDVKQVLLEMRKYRMGLIQTADQLRFSYLAVIEGAKFIMGDASVQVSAPGRELQHVGGRNRMERSFKFGACFSLSTSCLYDGVFRYSALQSVTTWSAVFYFLPKVPVL